MSTPGLLMPSAVEAALRALEHMDRAALVSCGADKRLRALAQTTATKKKAAAFDASFSSPRRLAAAYGSAGRSALLQFDFCARLVLEWSDVADAASLGACCALARVRARAIVGAWKALKRRLERADLVELEAELRTNRGCGRAMYWVLCRLARMGCEGVAYEHGRRLKLSESLRYSPQRVTELTALCRGAERSERPLYGARDHVGCPPKLLRFSANAYSVRHVNACERPDVHGWTRHSGSKYWTGVWGLLSRHCAVTRGNRSERSRFVLERFVFPRTGEEWVAVAEVAVNRRYYSPSLDLMAEIKVTSDTAYLKVKPANDRRFDCVGQRPPAFDRSNLLPSWFAGVHAVPAACMI